MNDIEDIKQKILGKVLSFLAYRARTKKELEIRVAYYLKSIRALNEEEKNQIVQYIFDYLQKNKLINDFEFAKLLIESKTKGKNVIGKAALERKLIAKGVDKDDARNLLEASVSEEDEVQMAVKLLKKKFGEGFSASREVQNRMGRYLASKGFLYQISRQAIDYLAKRP